LKEALAGAPIDVLWIAGDHTYEGVSQDMAMSAPLARRRGVVAMHASHRSDSFPANGRRGTGNSSRRMTGLSNSSPSPLQAEEWVSASPWRIDSGTPPL
jgi:hypothetical protein